MDNQKLFRVLSDMRQFLLARDRMNAAVHMEKVRWSPLTIQVEEAWARVAREMGQVDVKRETRGETE